jgi:hypothetical protein
VAETKTKAKAVNGSRKGSLFERSTCRALSLWVSDGQDSNLFWRTGGSGNRSTMARKRGGKIEAGQSLIDRFVVECKHHADLCIEKFLMEGGGKLGKIWEKIVEEAHYYGKWPLLIAKQNRTQTLAITSLGGLPAEVSGKLLISFTNSPDAHVYSFDDLVSGIYPFGVKEQPSEVIVQFAGTGKISSSVRQRL